MVPTPATSESPLTPASFYSISTRRLPSSGTCAFRVCTCGILALSQAGTERAVPHQATGISFLCPGHFASATHVQQQPPSSLAKITEGWQNGSGWRRKPKLCHLLPETEIRLEDALTAPAPTIVRTTCSPFKVGGALAVWVLSASTWTTSGEPKKKIRVPAGSCDVCSELKRAEWFHWSSLPRLPAWGRGKGRKAVMGLCGGAFPP